MERTTFQRVSNPQLDRIEEYCAKAHALLDTARDRKEALWFKDLMCSQFAAECQSSLVLAATNAYIEQVIRQRWEDGSETAETAKEADRGLRQNSD
jgi:hypothetical protein